MPSDDVDVASRFVKSVQGAIPDFVIRIAAVYRSGHSGHVVRLRLQRASCHGNTPNADNDEPIDSSYHVRLKQIIRKQHPLVSVTCSKNVLDNNYELEVSIPNKAMAWRLSGEQCKKSRVDYVFRTMQIVCFIALVCSFFPERILRTYEWIQSSVPQTDS